MNLSILYQDEREENVRVRRVFTFEATNAGPCLYYETYNHLVGQGKSIPLAEIKCWEVNADIPGSR